MLLMDNKDEIARYAKLSIVTLDQSVPPSNGVEWVSSVLAVYAETGLEHFALAAFCCPAWGHRWNPPTWQGFCTRPFRQACRSAVQAAIHHNKEE